MGLAHVLDDHLTYVTNPEAAHKPIQTAGSSRARMHCECGARMLKRVCAVLVSRSEGTFDRRPGGHVQQFFWGGTHPGLSSEACKDH